MNSTKVLYAALTTANVITNIQWPCSVAVMNVQVIISDFFPAVSYMSLHSFIF